MSQTCRILAWVMVGFDDSAMSRLRVWMRACKIFGTLAGETGFSGSRLNLVLEQSGGPRADWLQRLILIEGSHAAGIMCPGTHRVCASHPIPSARLSRGERRGDARTGETQSARNAGHCMLCIPLPAASSGGLNRLGNIRSRNPKLHPSISTTDESKPQCSTPTRLRRRRLVPSNTKLPCQLPDTPTGKEPSGWLIN